MIDLLIVEPSSDWKESLQRKMSMRIEKNQSVKEGLKISTGYLISAVKNNGNSVKFIDMIVENISVNDLIDYIKEYNPRIIGMPAFTIQIPVVIELFSKIKKVFPNIILGIGGCHVSSMAERTLNDYIDVDFVVRGEAETSLPLLIDRVISGDKICDIIDIPGVFVRGKKYDNNVYLEDVSSLSFPSWEDFKIDRYGGSLPHFGKKELPMLTGRGCPFKCIFCCRQLGGKCRRRTVESVIEEIERNIRDFNCDVISFLDETFVLNKSWINNFIDIMISSGLNKKVKWSCTTRVSSVSPKLLQRMNEAGCYYLFYGFESANENTLKIIKKGITPSQMKDAVMWAKQAGIVPTGSFIIGLPGDTRKSILETIEFGKNLDLYSITFPIAVPFPGTELRRMAINGEYGMRIISDDWSEYLANDFEVYGKGDIGHLESVDLLWSERRDLQRLAYKINPKKEILEYIKSIN